jgi:hypothetical protein
MEKEPVNLGAEVEETLAASLLNEVWTLLEQPNRTPDDDVLMLHTAHASRYHWAA